MSKTKQVAESLLIALWVIALTSLVIVGGCSVMPGPSEPPFPWKQRFMADVAIVSATSDSAPSPRPQPKVGDRCRDCNDPPGACGVGRVGDGRDCNRCESCGGDGRIDERDLASDIESEPLPVERSITLHMSAGSQTWGSRWWHESRQAFIDDGWDVSTFVKDEGVIPAPYFVVVDGGSSTQFHEPLTAELLQEWER